MAACKNHGSLYQDAAGKKSAGGQWEIDANQAIFPPLTQGYSRVSGSFAVTEILLSDFVILCGEHFLRATRNNKPLLKNPLVRLRRGCEIRAWLSRIKALSDLRLMGPQIFLLNRLHLVF
jgi:hypothetical protein